ncbi:hypothetical protein GCM10011360_07590 [Primorskyibacter flagellatus]|uniref:LysM domain-containing protein n=1 Tax=Primorskyibacter flagellatus TaxID=1387277 RepID=A0A917EDE6_9RHOB|nr:LysM peptidoglycan-binding domain-containing protein [Primorskyibacter flagellatus]GGE21443.1 hypothetical protein GCM10011360_07590 [Primorskyibacter flagellatus]
MAGSVSGGTQGLAIGAVVTVAVVAVGAWLAGVFDPAAGIPKIDTSEISAGTSTGEATGDTTAAEPLAAGNASEQDSAAVTEAPANEAPVTEAPETETPAPDAPRFDIVRAEGDGSVLVAGVAAPGARIQVLVDGVPAGEETAGPDGKFVAFLDLAESAAPRVLSLLSGEAGAEVASAAEVILGPTVAAEGSAQGASGEQVATVAPGGDVTVPGGGGTTVGADSVENGSAETAAAGSDPAPSAAGVEGAAGTAADTRSGAGATVSADSARDKATGSAAALAANSASESEGAVPGSEASGPGTTVSADNATSQGNGDGSSGTGAGLAGAGGAASGDGVTGTGAAATTGSGVVFAGESGTGAGASGTVDTNTTAPGGTTTAGSATAVAGADTSGTDAPLSAGTGTSVAANGSADVAGTGGTENAAASAGTAGAGATDTVSAAQTGTAGTTTASSATPGTTGTDSAAAGSAPATGPTVTVSSDTTPPASGTSAPATPDQASGVTAPASPPAPTVLLSDSQGVRVLQGPGGRTEDVAIDAITYSGSGAVRLAGRGAEGGFVRLYLDDKAVGLSEIGADGAWDAELADVASGVYRLRVDEVAADGSVTSRVETPFKREAPEVVAGATTTALAGSVTVQPGSTLWAIARDRYGEGLLYVRVFEANRDLIRDPDLIYPGQVFALPDRE